MLPLQAEFLESVLFWTDEIYYGYVHNYLWVCIHDHTQIKLYLFANPTRNWKRL